MVQLRLDDAPITYPVRDPRYPAYDRLHEGPLSAHELACLQAHGYTLIEHDAGGAVFDFGGDVTDRGNDYWRSEIDVLYLLAKNGANHGE